MYKNKMYKAVEARENKLISEGLLNFDITTYEGCNKALKLLNLNKFEFEVYINHMTMKELKSKFGE